MTPFVFISYSKNDAVFAKSISDTLERSGINTWWDDELAPGDSWRHEIEKHLENADVVIVIWSRNSVASRWVIAEAESALRRDKLIPVKIDDCKVPLPFGEIQHTFPFEKGLFPPIIYGEKASALNSLIANKTSASKVTQRNPIEIDNFISSISNFNAGSASNPAHPQKYCTSFEIYDLYCAKTGRTPPADEGWGRAERPVINVSFQDAIDFCTWASFQTGMRVRLPTTDEWNQFSQVTDQTAYPWGASWEKFRANVGNEERKTTPPGAFPANDLGVFDTIGNVWEWCDDEGISQQPKISTSPPRPINSKPRAKIMGCAWNTNLNDALFPFQKEMRKGYRLHYVGFRCVVE